MSFDYFYGEQSDQFSFYRIPKVFYTDNRFRSLSKDARVLYGILLDRVSLSARNRWFDEAGRVYIICTLQSVMQMLGITDKTATKLFVELENFGLIERKRQGQGKPIIIYVKNFIDSDFLRVQSQKDSESEIGIITSQWELEYKEQGKRCRHIYGSNDYLECWNDLIEAIGEVVPKVLDELIEN